MRSETFFSKISPESSSSPDTVLVMEQHGGKGMDEVISIFPSLSDLIS